MIAGRISTALLLLVLAAAQVAAQRSRPVKSAHPAAAQPQPPALTLEVGAVTPVVQGVKRASVQTVCAGDKVPFRALISDANITPERYAWAATGGQIVGEGAQVYLDTTDLTPGDYHVTAVAYFGSNGPCNNECASYDTKTIRISPCPPSIVCFTSPTLTIAPETRRVQPGEAVTFTTTVVSGGQGYGQVNYVWSSSAGTITGQGTTARLDTTGVAPEMTIEVAVTAVTEIPECTARGTARVMMLLPPPPPPVRELTPCVTFKRNNSRVDNACKYVLSDAVRALQADAQARLVVEAFRSSAESESVAFARGKNVRDRLADGSLGVTVDAHRIIVRIGGVATDGSQIKLFFVPGGRTVPPGLREAKLGPVEAEKKSAADSVTPRTRVRGNHRR